MAPELFQEKAIYNEKVDIYAASMIMWYLFVGECPLSDSDVKLYTQQAVRGETTLRPQIDCVTWKSYQYLIVRCWNNVPNDRPSATEIMTALDDMADDSNACAPRCVIA
jgi:hypothetical protein